jgi:hypothetical protein
MEPPIDLMTLVVGTMSLCQTWFPILPITRQFHRVGSHVIIETEEPSDLRVSIPDHRVLALQCCYRAV